MIKDRVHNYLLSAGIKNVGDAKADTMTNRELRDEGRARLVAQGFTGIMAVAGAAAAIKAGAYRPVEHIFQNALHNNQQQDQPAQVDQTTFENNVQKTGEELARATQGDAADISHLTPESLQQLQQGTEYYDPDSK